MKDNQLAFAGLESATQRLKRTVGVPKPEVVRRQTREASRRYYHRHPERCKQWQRKHYLSHCDKRKANARKGHVQKYGITLEDYDRLFESQNKACGICGQPWVPGKRRLAIDHDHVTKKVRGLLCSPCNTGLGRLGYFLKEAAAYLAAHERSKC